MTPRSADGGSLSKPRNGFIVPREDGWTVEGWLDEGRSDGKAGGASIPAVLEIHGGPHSSYGRRSFHEFQLFGARGGTAGSSLRIPAAAPDTGREFTKSIGKDWGGGDYRGSDGDNGIFCAEKVSRGSTRNAAVSVVDRTAAI